MEERTGATPLTILHFNDVYEVVAREGKEPVGGASRFATLVKQFAAQKPLVFFGGDAFNPSLLSTITKGKVQNLPESYMTLNSRYWNSIAFIST